MIAGNVDAVMGALGARFEGFPPRFRKAPTCCFSIARSGAPNIGKSIEDVECAAWDVGVAVQDGRMFGGPNHVRMNVALPHARVEEALDRLERHVFNA